MHNKKLLFPAACAGMLLFGISLTTLGSVAPELALKLGVDNISSGAIFSILPFGLLLGSLFFGPIADRFGYKFLLIASALILLCGFEGIAFSPSITVLKLFAFMIGFGGGAINGATNALVSDISETGKGADLSLLGVFFGVGALGMPLILGLLKDLYRFEVIVSAVGLLILATTIFYLSKGFPKPKHPQGFPLSKGLSMIKERYLIIIAFFLFFQSSFEGLLNNWTPTYLIARLDVEQSRALFALSSYVAGMTLMRLLAGGIFRTLNEKRLLFTSFGIILAGLLTLILSKGLTGSLAGLFLLGTGLASGFPVLLGITGNRYADLSGMAFSLVLSFALIGNMGFNYAMGYIAESFGIEQLPIVLCGFLVAMVMLGMVLFKKEKYNK